MPQPGPQYRIDPRARFRVLDDEGIFVLQEAGEVLAVNRVAAFIISQLEAAASLEEVCTALVDRFDVDEERARADLETFVASLVEAGAIVAS